ncbi:YWFCY domain-containing protein, partial [uncultured Duncaniella sp.]
AITWRHIIIVGAVGVVVFLFNSWLLPLGYRYTYIISTILGYVGMLMSGIWISRMLKNNMMDDRFNDENESFMQETRQLKNPYSINIPTRFYYEKRWHSGWINVVNPFRASIVLGTPGSGKSFAVVNNFLKQQIDKGFALYCYDFKFPDLSTIVYNHLKKNKDKYPKGVKFYV